MKTSYKTLSEGSESVCGGEAGRGGGGQGFGGEDRVP